MADPGRLLCKRALHLEPLRSAALTPASGEQIFDIFHIFSEGRKKNTRKLAQTARCDPLGTRSSKALRSRGIPGWISG